MISMQISFWNGIQFEQPKIETRICSFLQDVSILIVILIWKKKYCYEQEERRNGVAVLRW